jgi:hypothetical protein
MQLHLEWIKVKSEILTSTWVYFTLEIVIIAGIIGAVGGLLCSFVFFPKRMNDKTMNNKNDKYDDEAVANNKSKLTDRWSFRLAMLGFAMGIFAALGQGYLNIAFMIGFGLPFAVILSLIGFVIDYFRFK